MWNNSSLPMAQFFIPSLCWSKTTFSWPLWKQKRRQCAVFSCCNFIHPPNLLADVQLNYSTQLRQERFSIGNRKLARGFHVQLLDDAVFYQHGIALRTRPHAKFAEVGIQAQGF